MTVLIVISAIVIVFYTVIKSQGRFERNDLLSLTLIVGGAFALIYYLPKLLPEAFSILSTQSITQTQVGATLYNNTFAVMKDAATQIHNFVQTIIPIP